MSLLCLEDGYEDCFRVYCTTYFLALDSSHLVVVGCVCCHVGVDTKLSGASMLDDGHSGPFSEHVLNRDPLLVSTRPCSSTDIRRSRVPHKFAIFQSIGTKPVRSLPTGLRSTIYAVPLTLGSHRGVLGTIGGGLDHRVTFDSPLAPQARVPPTDPRTNPCHHSCP